MTTLVIDGAPTSVSAFCARSIGLAESAGLYLLDVLHSNGSAERWWAKAVGVQAYRRLQPCGGSWIW